MVNRVIVDANLLVVYVIGKRHPELLGNHRRVKAFIPNDYIVLKTILDQFNQIVLTPNVVTECSNLLSDDSDDDAKSELKALLHEPNTVVEETYVPSIGASSRNQYSYLGITDCALLELVNDQTVLLSTDSKLVAEALKINPESINFNHYRELI